MDDAVSCLDLPGFRFHPTEEELLEFYLRSVIFCDKLYVDLIGFLNIYRHDPWNLPDLAKIGEREWYFFVLREKKPSNGGRSSRTTPTGYWKATGSEKRVVSLSDPKRVIGFRKTLVFYKGRAPKGSKSDWIMNEYRLPDNCSLPKDIVLCKVYRKATSLKVLEKWAAAGEEETMTSRSTAKSTPLSSSGTTAASGCGPQKDTLEPMINCQVDGGPPWQEGVDLVTAQCQDGLFELPEPNAVDWAQVPLWAQLCSPWHDGVFNQTTCCEKIL